MALPSFLRWPPTTRASPPNASAAPSMMPGMGPYEPLPGSNEGQRRGRWAVLLAVGSAVVLALMVVVRGPVGARVEEEADTMLLLPPQQPDPSSLPEMWRGGGWLLPSPLLGWGTKPTGTGQLTPPAAAAGEGGGGSRHHNANGHGKPRHRHRHGDHRSKGEEEDDRDRLVASASSQEDKGGKCEIFVGVISRPGAYAERAAMRATWLGRLATEFGDRVQYRFFIGRDNDAPEAEAAAQQGNENPRAVEERLKGPRLAVVGPSVFGGQQQHGGGRELKMEEEDDVVRLPFVDSYYNLSVKTAALLRWPEQQGMQCRWLVKCDDDVYADPRGLVAAIEALPQEEPYVYAGHILEAHGPVRDPTSKWHMPTSLYAPARFPSYAEGPLYVLSQPLAAALPYQMDAAKDEVPSTYFETAAEQLHPHAALFRFEDVFIGELITRLLTTDPSPFAPATVHYVDLPFLYRNLKSEDATTSASSSTDDEKSKGKGGDYRGKKGKGKAGGGGRGHKRPAHDHARLGEPEPEPFAAPANPPTRITHLCPRSADPALVNVEPFEFVAVHGVTAERMRALHGRRRDAEEEEEAVGGIVLGGDGLVECPPDLMAIVEGGATAARLAQERQRIRQQQQQQQQQQQKGKLWRG